MLSNISGITQQYLADLDRNQTALVQAQGAVSTGLRVQQASDDPTVIAEILQTQNSISQNQQIQKNLASVTTEVNSADSALQTAISAMQSAISVATQGAGTTQNANTRAVLAEQISGIQQTLVGIAQTSVNGRYIFSGGQDTQPPYTLDATQPEGVQQLVTSASTRVIRSVDGTTFAVAKTAQEIFDARNPDGTAATGNVFAAVQQLYTALTNNDAAGSAAAVDSLKSAQSFLNNQLGFYGDVENRVQGATDLAQKFKTQESAQLSTLRDADIPTEATQITQLQTQEQASMEVEATVSQMKSLFSFLA